MSVYYQLLLAVQNLLGAIPGTQPWIIRKKLVVLETDKLPMCLIAPGRDGEKINFEAFPSTIGTGNVVWKYPVAIGYYQEGDAFLSTQLQSMMDFRAAIRDQIYQMAPLGLQSTGVPAMPSFDIQIDPEEVIQAPSYRETTIDATGFLMHYDVAETRKS
jgi:hypothetical protein